MVVLGGYSCQSRGRELNTGTATKMMATPLPRDDAHNTHGQYGEQNPIKSVSAIDATFVQKTKMSADNERVPLSAEPIKESLHATPTNHTSSLSNATEQLISAAAEVMNSKTVAASGPQASTSQSEQTIAVAEDVLSHIASESNDTKSTTTPAETSDGTALFGERDDADSANKDQVQSNTNIPVRCISYGV